MKHVAECDAWLDKSCIRHLAIHLEAQHLPDFASATNMFQISDLREQCPLLKTLRIVVGEFPDTGEKAEADNYIFVEIDDSVDFDEHRDPNYCELGLTQLNDAQSLVELQDFQNTAAELKNEIEEMSRQAPGLWSKIKPTNCLVGEQTDMCY